MIYEVAFNSWVADVWKSFPEYRIYKNDLAFRKALNCFINSGEDGIDDRKELMYAFLKNWLSHESAEDLLMRLREDLPTNNEYITKVLKNICQLYNLPVKRNFDNDKLQELLNDIDVNDVLDKAHKTAKLTGKIAATCWVVDGELEFKLITPEWYIIKRDLQGRMTEFSYISAKYNNQEVEISNIKNIKHELQWCLIRYTETERITEYADGTREVEPNEYKRIPFVELRLNDFNTYDMYDREGGMYDMVLEQLRLNAIEFVMQENELYGTIGVWVLTNTGFKDKVNLGAGRAILLEHKSIDIPPPDVRFQTAESNYDLLGEHKQGLTNRMLKMKGLPTSITSESKEMSGRAIELDRIELEEIRRLDSKAMSKFDNQLISLICDVYNIYIGSIQKPEKYNVRYSDLNKIADAKEYIELQNELLSKDVISIYDYMRNNGLEGSDEELQVILELNRDINGNVKRIDEPAAESASGDAVSGELAQENRNDRAAEQTDNSTIE